MARQLRASCSVAENCLVPDRCGRTLWSVSRARVGHTSLQEVAAPPLDHPLGHAAQLVPLCAANLPATHGLHVASPATLLPSAPPSPAGHGVPSHTERAPAAAAWVPLAQGTQVAAQMHVLSLQTLVLLVLGLKKAPPALSHLGP